MPKRDPIRAFFKVGRRVVRTGLFPALLCLFLPHPHALAQANGTLQIHFMNVGQGDGAVLISPGGQIVLFDSGVRNNCDLPLAYLQQLGVTEVRRESPGNNGPASSAAAPGG
jgi:hypothetical protein